MKWYMYRRMEVTREGKRKGQQMLIGWTRDGKEIREKEGNDYPLSNLTVSIGHQEPG
jgi:hypothetical protein